LRQAIVEGAAPNTQPIMAAALVGALDRSIAEAERENLPRPLVRLLDVGGPLLAQWGDRVIWGIARPLWAMAALVWAPFSAVAAALVFLGGALIGQAAARLELYRWGWKAGWDLVRGGHSRWWHVAPRWGERLHLPLILGVVGAVVVLWLRVDASTTASALRVAWFIIGGLLGGSVRRPMAWGWICCIAAAVGTALDVWWLPRGLG
jgi:mannose/fructose/N-acetylgalactosamine-specific phosphotransferase system component IID